MLNRKSIKLNPDTPDDFAYLAFVAISYHGPEPIRDLAVKFLPTLSECVKPNEYVMSSGGVFGAANIPKLSIDDAITVLRSGELLAGDHHSFALCSLRRNKFSTGPRGKYRMDAIEVLAINENVREGRGDRPYMFLANVRIDSLLTQESLPVVRVAEAFLELCGRFDLAFGFIDLAPVTDRGYGHIYASRMYPDAVPWETSLHRVAMLDNIEERAHRVAAIYWGNLWGKEIAQKLGEPNQFINEVDQRSPLIKRPQRSVAFLYPSGAIGCLLSEKPFNMLDRRSQCPIVETSTAVWLRRRLIAAGVYG